MSLLKKTEIVSKNPLSPHLQVWRWTLTMTMSILHRATGVANAIGLVMLIRWLLSAATGPHAYAEFTDFANSPVGRLMLIGWTFSVYLHLCSGIRHLIMDTGHMIDIKTSNRAVIVIWIAAVILTGLTWADILGGR